MWVLLRDRALRFTVTLNLGTPAKLVCRKACVGRVTHVKDSGRVSLACGTAAMMQRFCARAAHEQNSFRTAQNRIFVAIACRRCCQQGPSWRRDFGPAQCARTSNRAQHLTLPHETSGTGKTRATWGTACVPSKTVPIRRMGQESLFLRTLIL